MNAEDRLNNLLLMWQEAQAVGRDLSTTELCHDCPELAADLNVQIALLRHMNGLLQPFTPQNKMVLAASNEVTVQAQTGFAGKVGEKTLVVPAVPGYEILGELGRGGMGVVYKARQIRLNRVVALKMILAGLHADTQDQARFLQEAETIARLHHPNIVQVYEFGNHQGHAFFSLEYVPGGNLAERDRSKLQPAKEVAALLEKLARAMQVAHEQKIIHRDLKPANILLAADGTPKITDFGLAKQTDSGMTATGAVLGTPSYMSPEQAAGKTKEVGPASDVYALGAILYELVTGRAPFQAASILDTMRQVVEAPPIAPRQLQPSLPRDLETICLKCLQKEPGKRYRNALALAEDLRRFQEGEPIVARPASTLERAWKWARRRPALAALAATVVLATVALFVVGLIYNTQLQITLIEVEHQKKAVLEVQAEAEHRLTQAKWAQEKIRYIGDLDRAQRLWKEGWPRQAGNLLDHYHQTRLRGWEWYYLKRQLRGELLNMPGSICLAEAPTGKVLATVGLAGIDLRDPLTGKLVRTLPVPSGSIQHLCFDQSGSLLASAEEDGSLALWEVSTGRQLRRWKNAAHEGGVTQIALRPDGRQLATLQGSLKLWETKTGALQFDKKDEGDTKHSPSCLAYTADGQAIAVGTAGGRVVLWDSKTGVIQQQWQSKEGLAIQGLGFVADTHVLSVGTPRTVSWMSLQNPPKVLATATLPKLADDSWITQVTLRADGKRLLVGSNDGMVRLLAETGHVLAEWRNLGKHLRGLTFSCDGQRFTSLDENGIKIWDATSLTDRWSARFTATGLSDFAYSPDGNLLVLARTVPIHTSQGEPHEESVVELCAAKTGQVLHVVERTSHTLANLWQSASFQRVAFSPDSKRLAVVDCLRTVDKRAESMGTVRVWDLAAKREVLRLEKAGECVAFSPDGSWIATLALPEASQGSKSSRVHLWNATTGKIVHTYEHPGKRGRLLVFSPDGKYLALGGGQITLLEISEGSLHRVLEWSEAASCLVFSPDGKWLASSSRAGHWSLWDLQLRRLQHTQGKSRVVVGAGGGTFRPSLADTPVRLAFSPDSQRLAYATDYRTVRLWDVADGQDILSLEDFPTDVDRLFFSRDGHQLFAVDSQPRWHVWDATPLPDAALYEQLARQHILDYSRQFVSAKTIREHLVSDPELSAAARQVALQQLEQWSEAPHHLNGLAWETVAKAGASVAAYQLALRQINRACELIPDAPNLLNTLGVAQYRVGHYRESLETLRQTQKLRPEQDREAFEDLAFLAMAYQRLGETDQACAFLKRLRTLAEVSREPLREELYQRFLREAEQVLKKK